MEGGIEGGGEPGSEPGDRWCEEYGGELCMLDETHGCWWSVPPTRDTLVLFRSDRILHKVLPCHGHVRRYALTMWLSASTEEADREAEAAALRSIVSGFV